MVNYQKQCNHNKTRRDRSRPVLFFKLRPVPTANDTIKIKPLSELIGALKTTSSKWIHRNGFNNFKWQRSFYDHIIRDEKSYFVIQNYINQNPAKWWRNRNNFKISV